MKKLTLIISALALVLGMSQCNKPEMPTANIGTNGGYTQDITINVNCGDGSEKVTIEDLSTGLLNIGWEVGSDKLAVDGGATGKIECVSSTGNAGAFYGTIHVQSETDLTFTYGEEPNFSEQDGTLEWIKNNFYLTSGNVPFQKSRIYEFGMAAPYAVLKLDLRMLGTDAGNDVAIRRDGVLFATIHNVKNTPKDVYIAVPVGKAKYTFVGRADNSDPTIIDHVDKTWNVEADKFYTKGGTGEAFVVEHEFVVLGLPSGNLWATCNVGSGAPDEYGIYYQWGGLDSVTELSKDLNWTNCPHTDGRMFVVDVTLDVFTKYTVNPNYVSPSSLMDNRDNLELEDDASYYMWGHRAKMASKDDFQELYDNCSKEWVNNYNGTGINGLLLTSNIAGYTDKCIFLPAAGTRKDRDLLGSNEACRYWSTTLYTDQNNHGLYFYYQYDGQNDVGKHGYRFFGRPIRAIKKN